MTHFLIIIIQLLEHRLRILHTYSSISFFFFLSFSYPQFHLAHPSYFRINLSLFLLMHSDLCFLEDSPNEQLSPALPCCLHSFLFSPNLRTLYPPKTSLIHPVPFAVLEKSFFFRHNGVENRRNLKQLFLPLLCIPEVQETERKGIKVTSAQKKGRSP